MLSCADNVEGLSDDADDQPTAGVDHVQMNSARGRESESTVVRTP